MLIIFFVTPILNKFCLNGVVNFFQDNRIELKQQLMSLLKKRNYLTNKPDIIYETALRINIIIDYGGVNKIAIK